MAWFENLKNQKKVEEVVNDVTASVEPVDEELSEPAVEPTVETKEETKEEKKARIAKEKADAKLASTLDADSEPTVEEIIEPIYFVNSNCTNLQTFAWDFKQWLLIATNIADANIVRCTEDYKRGFIKEMTKAEYEASKA